MRRTKNSVTIALSMVIESQESQVIMGLKVIWCYTFARYVTGLAIDQHSCHCQLQYPLRSNRQ